MGLDMYLEGNKYIGFRDDCDPVKDFMKSMYGIKYKIQSITVEFGYWRKCWDLQGLFTDECEGDLDNNQHLYVSEKNLKNILAELIRIRDDPDADHAAYNLSYTIEIFEKLISDNVFKDYDLQYTASC